VVYRQQGQLDPDQAAPGTVALLVSANGLVVEATRRVYDGRIVSLRRDTIRWPDGSLHDREVVEHKGAVAIVALIRAEIVVMVSQYRHAVGEWLLEIPAGTIEEGEDPEWCAARELEEETGYVAERMRRLFAIYTSPGFCNEVLHVYLAEELNEGTIRRDPDEDMEVTEVALADVPAMIHDGRIRDGKTIAALLAVLAGR
jgi:ADP-ribose pyrophosphatase